jgi:hypothetical protein
VSTRKKIGITVAVLVCAPVFIAGMISAARQSLDSKSVPSPSNKPGLPSAAPTPSIHPAKITRSLPADQPTFKYPGDRQCAITYRDNGNRTMSWIATVTLSGELITHVSDISGNLYRRDVQVTPGPNGFTAPVPLSKIDDIGGVLYVGRSTYGCSVAPQRPK